MKQEVPEIPSPLGWKKIKYISTFCCNFKMTKISRCDFVHSQQVVGLVCLRFGLPVLAYCARLPRSLRNQSPFRRRARPWSFAWEGYWNRAFENGSEESHGLIFILSSVKQCDLKIYNQWVQATFRNNYVKFLAQHFVFVFSNSKVFFLSSFWYLRPLAVIFIVYEWTTTHRSTCRPPKKEFTFYDLASQSKFSSILAWFEVTSWQHQLSDVIQLSLPLQNRYRRCNFLIVVLRIVLIESYVSFVVAQCCISSRCVECWQWVIWFQSWLFCREEHQHPIWTHWSFSFFYDISIWKILSSRFYILRFEYSTFRSYIEFPRIILLRPSRRRQWTLTLVEVLCSQPL